MYVCAVSHSSAFSPRLSQERGNALSELMIVTPFVVAVMLATIELSFSIKNHASMVEAARVAARAAAILPPDSDSGSIRSFVVSAVGVSLEHAGISESEVSIDVETPEVEIADGRYVRVRLQTQPQSFVAALVAGFAPRTVMSTFPLAVRNNMLAPEGG